MTQTDDLIARLETKQPYKSALQIACEDDGIGAQVIVLGQGDYPSMRQLADRATDDMNEAATCIRQQAARIAELEGLLDETNEIMFVATLGEHELTSHIDGSHERKKARIAHFRNVRAALKREG